MKKSIEEVKERLLENRVDENGDLDLRGLDFSGFEGDIDIGSMKVKKDLYQDKQVVDCYLWQDIVWMHKDNCETVRFPAASYTDIIAFAYAWAR